MKHYAVATALAAMCFSALPSWAEDIAIAVHVEPSNEMYLLAQRVKSEIEKTSDGKLTVTVLGQEVGGERDQVEGASAGEYQIALGGSVPMSLYAPKFAASDLPFVWTSSDEARKVYEGSLGDKVQQALALNGNLHLLGISIRNPRDLTSNKPVKTPDDVAGARLRVPEIATWVDVWKAEGALPSPIAWPEVYTSLQTGVIDMQENPVGNILSGKLYEVQGYVNKTEHVYSFFHWLANNDWWEGLSDGDRKIVQAAFDDSITWGDEQVIQHEEAITKELEDKGMQVVEVDKAAFRAKAKPVIEKIAETLDPTVRNYVLSKLNK